VAEDNHQRHVQVGDRVAEAGRRRSIAHVARGADDEQVAQPLVKHDLRRDPRVGAAEDRGPRPLAGGEVHPPGRVLMGMAVGATRVALVPVREEL
jgi:hypothetical protein